MNAAVLILLIVLVAGIAIGAYALLAPRAAASEPAPPQPPLEPLSAGTGWTEEAGAEFAGLSEAARCDLIFAVGDLDDERSHRLLLHALDDPSDAVALAAAHALVRRGGSDAVDAYAHAHPGARAERIVSTLALME